MPRLTSEPQIVGSYDSGIGVRGNDTPTNLMQATPVRAHRAVTSAAYSGDGNRDVKSSQVRSNRRFPAQSVTVV